MPSAHLGDIMGNVLLYRPSLYV